MDSEGTESKESNFSDEMGEVGLKRLNLFYSHPSVLVITGLDSDTLRHIPVSNRIGDVPVRRISGILRP